MLKKISEKFIVCLFFILILFLSCPPPNNSLFSQLATENNNQFGSLTLDVFTNESRTFVPDIDMKPAIFEITGTGPNNKTFDDSTINQKLSIADLLVGEWTIIVYANNKDGILIGQGSAVVNIFPRKNVTASITIIPIQGIGTFNMDVSWTSKEICDPVLIFELYPSNGPIIESEIQLSTEDDFTFAQATFINLPNGYYTLQVKLFDGENLKIGAMEIVRIIAGQVTSGSIVFENIAGNDGNIIINMDIELDEPIDVSLSPENLKIAPGKEFKLNSQVTSNIGNLLYIWYVNGEQINDASGSSFVFKENNVGLYRVDVKCFLADGSRAGSASSMISVEEALPPEDDEWTFMIYLDGDNNLEGSIINHINQMEAVDLTNENINIIVLADRIEGFNSSNGNWTGTRLYKINYDITNNYELIYSTQLSGMGLSVNYETELNMGSGDTLNDFVNFCQNEYPAPNYALILFNHGDGWFSEPPESTSESATSKAVCIDNTNGNDSLSIKEIKEVLLDKNIDVLGFDACLMAMVEVAYELKDCANIMIASEEVIATPGWGYKKILENFIISDKTPKALAEAAVETLSEFQIYRETTISAVSLNKMDNLISAINLFAENLIQSDFESIRIARESSQLYVDSLSIDLYDFADHISCPGSEEVKAALNECVIANKTNFIIGHGLSIYFPKISYASDYYAYNSKVIDFVDDSIWDEFLTTFIDLPLNSDPYEPDDLSSEATEIAIGEVQDHNLHSSIDTDYYQFAAEANHRYTIETFYPIDDIEKKISIYDQDGITALLSDDDPNNEVLENDLPQNTLSNSYGINLQPKFSWTCSSDGTYYFSIIGNSSSIFSKNCSLVGDYSVSLKDTTPGLGEPIDWCGTNWIPGTRGKWTVQGDELVMTGVNIDTISYIEAEENYNNFTLSVDVMKSNGSPFLGQGFVFRKNGNNFYVFSINNYDGFFQVMKYNNGKFEESLVLSTNIDAVKPCLKTWNSISMEAYESTYKFYSNGTLLTTIEDSTYSEGTVGLFSYDTADDVFHFRNAVLAENTAIPDLPEELLAYGIEIIQNIFLVISNPELPTGITSSGTEQMMTYDFLNYSYLPENPEAVIATGGIILSDFFNSLSLGFKNDPKGIDNISMSSNDTIKINGTSFSLEENTIVFP